MIAIKKNKPERENMYSPFIVNSATDIISEIPVKEWKQTTRVFLENLQ